MHPSPLNLTTTAWRELLERWGQPAFRAKQIQDWLYHPAKRLKAWEDAANLPKDLRARLSAELGPLRALEISRVQGSADSTRKILLRLPDHRYIESVLIPANPDLFGERTDRRTLCVSTQVGCAMACGFCASGLAGLTRNLETFEIVEQILQAEELSGERVDNLVFMGMGEPLANLKALLPALEILNGQIGIGARKMTISTSGLAPQIEKLAAFPLQVRLALSLHGATDEVREQIMPVNRKWPIAEVMQAIETWRRSHKQRVTFEFILIEGVNDQPEQARALAKLARTHDAKVNLIPYNTVEGLPWSRPSEAVCKAFAAEVQHGHAFVTLRLEKGHDIDAACGQLRLQQETQEGILPAPAKAR